MTTGHDQKICAILLAMGGPESIDDVPEYLYNIFSDRMIIKLPGGPLFQKPLARLISKGRASKIKEHYKLIGGRSPLLDWTKKQAEQIEAKISQKYGGFRCYVGMRYFEPYIDTVIGSAVDDGFTDIIFLPMYPQYSLATTGSCFFEVKKAMAIYRNISSLFVNDFHEDRSYINLLREYISRNKREDEIILYSAHSLPQKFINNGDPYVAQIEKTAELASAGQEYHISFQSRTGPVKWVGPETVLEARRLIEEGKSLFIVPISFVCDHIETLYELDIELKEMLGSTSANKISRMPMFNDNPRFAELLSDLILRSITGHG